MVEFSRYFKDGNKRDAEQYDAAIEVGKGNILSQRTYGKEK